MSRFGGLPFTPPLLSRLTLGVLSLGALAGAQLIDAGTAHAAAAATSAATARTLYVSAKATAAPTCATATAKNPFPTIADALSCAQSGDTVKIGAGTFAGQFTVSANITLEGAGVNETTVANPPPTDADPAELTIAPDASVGVEDLTVNGEGPPTLGVSGGDANAGISDAGASLVLDKVAVTGTNDQVIDETTVTAAAAVTVAPPSGQNGTLTVLDSTVSNNSGYEAGGILMDDSSASTPSSLEVVNSTISDNYGTQGTGGIEVYSSTASLRDDTIADNTGGVTGGLGVYTDGAATVTDTLLATNTGTSAASDDDCHRASTGTVTSGGHNLVGVVSPTSSGDCGFVNGVNGDLTGTPTSPLNPQLGALAHNGGPTETQALLPGSPAIGAGNPADCEAAPVNDLDQRGDPRNATARLTCDIGAYDTGGQTS